MKTYPIDGNSLPLVCKKKDGKNSSGKKKWMLSAKNAKHPSINEALSYLLAHTLFLENPLVWAPARARNRQKTNCSEPEKGLGQGNIGHVLALLVCGDQLQLQPWTQTSGDSRRALLT
jgi:hypothetical protein